MLTAAENRNSAGLSLCLFTLFLEQGSFTAWKIFDKLIEKISEERN